MTRRRVRSSFTFTFPSVVQELLCQYCCEGQCPRPPLLYSRLAALEHHQGVYGAHTHKRGEEPEPTILCVPFLLECESSLPMLIVHVDDVVTLEVQGCHPGSRNFSVGRISIGIHPPLYVRFTRVGSGRTNTTRHDEVKVRLTILLPANCNELNSIHGCRQYHLRSRSPTMQSLFNVSFRITSVSILQDAHVIVVPVRGGGNTSACVLCIAHLVFGNGGVSTIHRLAPRNLDCRPYIREPRIPNDDTT